jgi:hypothetical protein
MEGGRDGEATNSCEQLFLLLGNGLVNDLVGPCFEG